MTRRIPNQRDGEVDRICSFLDRFTYTKAMWEESYEYWHKGESLEGEYWQRKSGLGGTYTMQALMWYRHIHRPGTPIYRPSLILEALCVATAATGVASAAVAGQGAR